MKRKILVLFVALATFFAAVSCSGQGKKTENDFSDYESFKGKTVVTVGAGGTPDVIFRHILAAKGIEINGEGENSADKVTVDYASDASAVIQKLKTGDAEYAILGEPAVTTVCGKTGKKVVLDLQSAFKTVHSDVNFVQAGLFATNSITKHSALINALVNKLGENKNFVYENKSDLKDLFERHDSSLKNSVFTDELLDRCNIGMKKAGEVKKDVEAFLNTVKEFNAQQIGGKLPESDFYYDFSAENSAEYAKTAFKIGVVDGAPSLAVANILDGFSFADGETSVSVSVELVGGADAIRAGLLSGDFDMAIAPLNLASALYNAKPEKGINLLSVNIFGCLYLIG